MFYSRLRKYFGGGGYRAGMGKISVYDYLEK